ncbi:MAG: beta/gamma crystallin-related protein [Pseudomonadota bacterium]
MKITTKTILALAIGAACSHAMAQQITLYQDDNWHGRVYATNGAVPNLGRVGFNDRASSVIVEGGRWEVCEDANFQGHCMILRAGSYNSLYGMGMNDRISSLRPASRRHRYDDAPEPMQQADYEYRQRPREQIYQAEVRSVHAVMGAAEQRCWVERQQVADSGNHSNVGGAIAGALIGGVLGHQVGGGTGRDVATAGGAVAGAAIGSNMGSGSSGSYGRETRRCENVASTTPQYWDVIYVYRGVEHSVQLAAAPGQTIPVNRDGLPRM